MATGRDVGVSLAQMADSLVLLESSPATQRSAAVTTAEAAMDGGWSRDDLVDVLGALGLTEAAS